MKRTEALYVYLNAFIEELSRNGVRHVVYCPGSRSTPLALRLIEHPRLRCWLHLDERSAAFFALGMAKRLREPVALLCTSGTAAVNFAPAVVEAHYARVPLLLLTADRPPELRDAGAPQTIDQLHLFGRHVRWFLDMALPEGEPELLRYVRTVAAKAVAAATGPHAGPVHLNFPFREPLIPDPPAQETAHPWSGDRMGTDGNQQGAAGTVRGANMAPYAAVTAGVPVIADDALERLADLLTAAERGVIVCGPQTDPGFSAAVVQLAERLQFPLLADPLSQVRCGRHSLAAVVDAYDALLRAPSFVEKAKPDIVLRFGGLPVSKPLLQYLQRYADVPQLVVDVTPVWSDPAFSASEVLLADAADLCRRLAAKLEERAGRLPQTAAAPDRDEAAMVENLRPADERGAWWLSWWRAANRRARQVMAKEMAVQIKAAGGGADAAGLLFEGRIFQELASLLPEGCVLFAGNSMPVRDLDSFFPALEKELAFFANRGANGIDGVVSSALGASAAGDSPALLVIGDLSFYHDLNGLLAAKLHRLNLTVVLVNNDGGGIFSFLPQANHPRHFEALFGTPHGLDFAPAVAMYGGRHVRAASWEQFAREVRKGLAEGGLHVIEVRSRREDNARRHRRLWEMVARELEALPPLGEVPEK